LQRLELASRCGMRRKLARQAIIGNPERARPSEQPIK